MTSSGTLVVDGISYPWTSPSRPSGPPHNGVGFFDNNHSASTSGTYTATLTWIGSGPPPSTVAIDVYAQARGGNAVPTADNGLGDPAVITVDMYGQDTAVSTGKHLKILNVSNGVATYTGSISASGSMLQSPQGGLVGGVLAGWSVTVDNRFAKILVDGHPANYRKQPTGVTKPYPYPVTLSDGRVRPLFYQEAIPVLNQSPTATGNNAFSSIGTLYLGLPVQSQVRALQPDGSAILSPSVIPPYPISFAGDVFQSLTGTEHYDWDSDRGGFGSDCPTFLFGWELRNENNVYASPAIITTNYDAIGYPVSLTTVDTLTGDIGGNAWISLHYKWNDGLVADCKDLLEFHMGIDNPILMEQGEFLDWSPSYDWRPIPFSGGVAWVPAANGTYPAVLTARNMLVIIDRSFIVITLAALSTVTPVALPFAIAAAAYGIFLSFSPEADTTLNIPKGDITAFNDANLNGRVGPVGWEGYYVNYVPGDNSTLHLEHFDWKADYRPQVLYDYYVSDVWTLDGYFGQEFSHTEKPESLATSERRYHFSLRLPE